MPPRTITTDTHLAVPLFISLLYQCIGQRHALPFSRKLHFPGSLTHWLPVRLIQWEALEGDWRVEGREKPGYFSLLVLLGVVVLSVVATSPTMVPAPTEEPPSHHNTHLSGPSSSFVLWSIAGRPDQPHQFGFSTLHLTLNQFPVLNSLSLKHLERFVSPAEV